MTDPFISQEPSTDTLEAAHVSQSEDTHASTSIFGGDIDIFSHQDIQSSLHKIDPQTGLPVHDVVASEHDPFLDLVDSYSVVHTSDSSDTDTVFHGTSGKEIPSNSESAGKDVDVHINHRTDSGSFGSNHTGMYVNKASSDETNTVSVNNVDTVVDPFLREDLDQTTINTSFVDKSDANYDDSKNNNFTPEENIHPGGIQSMIDRFIDPFLSSNQKSSGEEFSATDQDVFVSSNHSKNFSSGGEQSIHSDVDPKTIHQTVPISRQQDSLHDVTNDNGEDDTSLGPSVDNDASGVGSNFGVSTVHEHIPEDTHNVHFSDIIEKFITLRDKIHTIYQYQDTNQPISLVGANTSKFVVKYQIQTFHDPQTIVITKIQTENNVSTQHTLRFVYDTDMYIYVDDVLLFDGLQQITDKKDIVLIDDKFNKFILLVNTYIDTFIDKSKLDAHKNFQEF